jgi:large subunit ribosomal protein L21
MYAVIEDGGKQYKVGEGETLRLERKDAQPGQTVQFDRVLLLSREGEVRIGTPTVQGAKVVGVVQGEEKGEKLTVMRFRRRRGYQKKQGHRQLYTVVRIEKIEFPGAAPA